MTLNKNTIISREKLDDGTLIFETKEVGKDNKKKALIYHRYELATNRLAIIKKVKVEGAEQSFTRNQYLFQR